VSVQSSRNGPADIDRPSGAHRHPADVDDVAIETLV